MREVRRLLRQQLEEHSEGADRLRVKEDLALLLVAPDSVRVHARLTAEGLKGFRRLYDEREHSPGERAWLVLLLHLLATHSHDGGVQAVAQRFKRSLCEGLTGAATLSDEEALLCFLLLSQCGCATDALETRARAVDLERERQREDSDAFFLPALAKCAGLPVRCGSVFEKEFSLRCSVRGACSCLWGMAGSKNAAAFEGKAQWLLARPELWQSEPHLFAFASFLEETCVRRRQVRPSLKSVIAVDSNRTRLHCPICYTDMLDPADEDEVACPLHAAVAQFQCGAATAVAPLVDAALTRLDWWSETDKAQFLEVLCGVTGMHELHVVTVDDLHLQVNSGRVCFDTTSFEGFCQWFRDKLERAHRFPYYRFNCARQIRDIWSRHPEGREVERALAEAKEAVAPVLAAQAALEARTAGHLKGIKGLSQSLAKPNEEKKQLRVKQLEEKQTLLAEARRELEEITRHSPELAALAEAERQWHSFLFETSQMGEAMERLASYNASVARIRSGSIGKEGMQFEHECLRIVEHFFNPSGDPAIRVLRSVKLRGVQFPVFATSEFDFWVVRGNEVLFVIEMKRSTGAVRGNFTKKMSAISYLLSDAFGGAVYEGLQLTRDSFARFRGNGFFEHMYFFAREPVTVRDDEDVFAMFIDNDDAFLSVLMDVPQQLDTPEFYKEACKKGLCVCVLFFPSFL